MRLLLPLTAALTLAPLDAGAAELPFELKTTALDNGMRLVMVPYASPGLIAYYTMVRVGSRDEVEPGVTGFAHFFEHMMFRGTDQHPPERVDALLKKTGADQNGFTTDDFTCYTFFGSNSELEALIAYEADRVQNLKYTEDVFRTEAKAVLGEYNKSASSPYLKLEERLRELTFKTHTYGHTTMGFLKDIEAMPEKYEYSKTFFQRFYTPHNITLIVVGDFDPAKLEALVRQHYGAWTRPKVESAVKAEPPQAKELRDVIPWKTPTLPLLSMSWRTPATDYTKADTAVYNVAFELLFGRISPLYTELVLDQQLVDDFDDWSRNFRDPNVFQVIAKVKDPAKLEQVERRIDRAISDMASGKTAAQLLADVKAHVKYGLLLGLDTPPKIAGMIAFGIAPTGELDGLAKLLAGIERVTLKDVQSFAKSHLVAKKRAVLVVKTEEAGR